jgi:hypothetical protein
MPWPFHAVTTWHKSQRSSMPACVVSEDWVALDALSKWVKGQSYARTLMCCTQRSTYIKRALHQVPDLRTAFQYAKHVGAL